MTKQAAQAALIPTVSGGMEPQRQATSQESTNGEAEIVHPSPINMMVGAIELALKSGAGVEQLTRIFEFYERMDNAAARKAFDVDFAAFKAEAPKLEKSKVVAYKDVKYKYTPLDEIANNLGPILAKHGLSYNWKQESTKESITVTCILRHTQGHSIENTLSAGADTSGSKNAIQAIGSAVSYLRRYTLLGVLGMATSDEDNDGAMNDGQLADWFSKLEEARNLEDLKNFSREAIDAATKAEDHRAVRLLFEKRDKCKRELSVKV